MLRRKVPSLHPGQDAWKISAFFSKLQEHMAQSKTKDLELCLLELSSSSDL